MREGWKYERLGDITSIITGKLDANAAHQDGIYPFFTCSKYPLRINSYSYECECVLIAGNGDLNVKYYNGKFDAYQRTYIISVKKCMTEVSVIYLFWFLSFYIDILREKRVGSTVKYIKLGDLTNILIPIPPLNEQQRIVEYLDTQFAKIDAIKVNAEKQLQDAKDLFQSALKDLLTLKEGWEKKKLEEISTDMYRGSGITREQVRAEGIPCVRYGEIYTKYDYWFDKCYSYTDEQIIKSRKYFEYGDILFAITGESVEEIGKSVAYMGKDKCLAGGDIVVMKHNQNPRYMVYALASPNAIIQKGLGKTKLKVVHTNIPSLKSIVIPIPPLEEQEEIANLLDDLICKLKQLQSNYEKTITLCNDLKQSILKDIFG